MGSRLIPRCQCVISVRGEIYRGHVWELMPVSAWEPPCAFPRPIRGQLISTRSESILLLQNRRRSLPWIFLIIEQSRNSHLEWTGQRSKFFRPRFPNERIWFLRENAEHAIVWWYWLVISAAFFRNGTLRKKRQTKRWISALNQITMPCLLVDHGSGDKSE